MGYKGFKESKKVVREAGQKPPEACRRLVYALYGKDTGDRLIEEYRSNRGAKQLNWLQAILHRAAS